MNIGWPSYEFYNSSADAKYKSEVNFFSTFIAQVIKLHEIVRCF